MKRFPLAFDIETHLFEPGNMAPPVVCLSWANDRGGSGLEVGQETIESWLHGALDMVLEGARVLVGCNVAYDMTCILAHFPSVWDKVWWAYEMDGVTCVSIREGLLDIAVGEFGYPMVNGRPYHSKYSLADIAKVRLGKTIEKGDDTYRLRYAELDGVPVEDWPRPAVDYAVNDSIVTLEAWHSQEERARGLNYSIPTEFLDVRAQMALKLMSVRGVEIDSARVDKEWNSYIDKMEGLSEQIKEDGIAVVLPPEPVLFGQGRRPVPDIKQNMARTRAAIELYYPGKPPRTKPTVRFPEGQIKTGAEVVAECTYPPLERITEFNKYQKLCNTYLNKLFVSPVHASFWPVGGATDRTSCSAPNLQNPPRKEGIRECIVARKGHVLIFTDFDSQEMRTLAQACQDLLGGSMLAERYRGDRMFDPHLDFAERIAGDKAAEYRQHAKIANFGFPGGMIARTFVKYARGWGLDLDLDMGERLRRSWFEQWPEMDPYFDHIKRMIGPLDYGTLIHPRTGFRRGRVAYTEAANTYFQHLGAVCSKQALWDITLKAYTRRDSYLYGSRPVLFIHDEVGMETPEQVCHEAAQEMEETMVAAMEKWTPDVPAAASARAMYRWSKKAKRVEESGRVVAWAE